MHPRYGLVDQVTCRILDTERGGLMMNKLRSFCCVSDLWQTVRTICFI